MGYRTYTLRSTGGKFRACNSLCADAFKEDRRAGLNYGLHQKPNGGFFQNREEWSLVLRRCAYCGADVAPPK